MNQLTDYELEQEMNRVRVYLTGKIAKRTMEEIADELNVSRVTLYKYINRWQNSGLLAKVTRELLAPQIEDVRAAMREVLADWPEILREVKRIALNARSEHVRLEAAQLLNTWVVKPLTEEQDDEPVRELNYTKTAQSFDPTEVPDAALTLIVEKPLMPRIIQG
jgi:predicted transcriptional regulator